MKKTSLLLLFIAAISSATKAQYFTHSDVSHPQICLMSVYQYNINDTDINLSVKSYLGDGFDTTIYLASNQNHAYINHFYASPGTYTIRSILYKNSTPLDTVYDTHSIFCDYVMLSTYMDHNNNCIQDYNENFTRDSVQVEVDSAGTLVDTIAFYGATRYKTEPNTLYKFRELTPPLGTIVTCPSTGIFSVTTPSAGFGGYVSFGHNCTNNTIFDLNVKMSTWFRTVNNSYINIQANNDGCGLKNGTVILTLDSKYKFKSSVPAPANINGQIITWTLTGLSNTNSQYIYAIADTLASMKLGDTVCNTVTITPVTGDLNTANNTLNECDIVRAAWDPNNKVVTPSGDILPGTKLTYTVNFENLGSDTAFNVHVLDTLSAHLDATTLQVISSSHPIIHFFVTNNIGKNIVKFDFPNIRLADSSAKQYNKGSVTFSIKTKTGLPYHTQIPNRAGIFFDINPVVLTNYTENRIAAPVSIENITTQTGVNVYPNPTDDRLTIETSTSSYNRLQILNNLGQSILDKTIDGNITTLSIKQLVPGIYHLVLKGEQGVKVMKVMKQ